MKQTMRAVQYNQYGPPDVLKIAVTPVPELRQSHVLIQIVASSVNAADVQIRKGGIKLLSGQSFPKGTGFDFSGTIVAVADDVADFRPGEKVWGFLTNIKQPFPAAMADYVVAPIGRFARRPLSLDAVSAAALPGVGGSVIDVLANHARLQAGEKILIRGAAGGVGTAAVQVARAMKAQVTALVSGKHIQPILALGAQTAYDYHTVNVDKLGRFDVVLDLIGKNMAPFRKLLTTDGRLLAMNLGGLGDVIYMLLSRIYGKHRIRFVQCPPDEKLLTRLTTLVETGAVKPVIDSLYTLENIIAAHHSVEAGGGFGKRVVKISLD